MKIYNKLLAIFIFTISIANADISFVEEPVFNSNMYVQTYGNPNNEVVVFVHGLGDEASTIWESSIDKLKEEYFIIKEKINKILNFQSRFIFDVYFKMFKCLFDSLNILLKIA